MTWISVDDDLPEDWKPVLVLVYGVFPEDNPLRQKASCKIFEAKFHRSYGWDVPFC